MKSVLTATILNLVYIYKFRYLFDLFYIYTQYKKE